MLNVMVKVKCGYFVFQISRFVVFVYFYFYILLIFVFCIIEFYINIAVYDL